MTKILKTFLVLACVLAMPSLSLLAATGDGPTLLPQITGVQDDGSPEGVGKAKLTRGQLVKMPFINGKFASDNISGSATANFFSAAGQGNPDGTGGTLIVTVPNNGGVRVLQTFYGSVFGVRWIRGTADFGVSIDGVAYRVTSTLKEPESASAITATAEYENLTIVADDLPDAPHVAEFVFVNSTGSQIIWQLWGYTVEQRVGHGGIPRVAGVINATTVPNTDTAIFDTTFHSLRKIYYYNTDTVTRTVTIKQNNKIIDTLVMTTLTGKQFDPGDYVALTTTASGTGQFSHACDAASVVNFMPIGGL